MNKKCYTEPAVTSIQVSFVSVCQASYNGSTESITPLDPTSGWEDGLN